MIEAGAARSTLIGVSLKMYMDPERTLGWSRRVAAVAKRHGAVISGSVMLWVLPSFPVLSAAVDLFKDTAVQVGAQDLFWEDRGPYTGAVSGADLAQIGCRLVEVGHAERRGLFGDDNDSVKRKTSAAVRNGLTPLLCIGEPDNGSIEAAQAYCIEQLESALGWLTPADGKRVPLAVAYEPVWAIGQAQAADPTHVMAVAGAVTSWLAARPHLAGSPVIYGGSAGPGMLSRLNGTVDGLFLGRFAHDTDALESILDEAAQAQ